MNTPFFSHLHPWTWLVLAALLLGLLTRFVLAQRQMKHVWQNRHAVPAAFADHIDLQSHQKAAAYTLAKTQLSTWQAFWGAATFVGWTWLGGLEALNGMLTLAMGSGLMQQWVLLGLVTLISSLLHLPLAWYQVFHIETRFGFNRQTLRLWLIDQVKSSLVMLVLGGPLAAAVLWLMHHQAMWWLTAWLLWVAFSVLMMVIYPTWIAPRFNRFTPMPEGPVKTRIEQLMQRCGFASKGLYVMDGSKRSGHGNAYFTGFGPAKRVVFFDTLLERLDADEIEAVLAHELGHFKKNHLKKRLMLTFGLSALGFALDRKSVV